MRGRDARRSGVTGRLSRKGVSTAVARRRRLLHDSRRRSDEEAIGAVEQATHKLGILTASDTYDQGRIGVGPQGKYDSRVVLFNRHCGDLRSAWGWCDAFVEPTRRSR